MSAVCSQSFPVLCNSDGWSRVLLAPLTIRWGQWPANHSLRVDPSLWFWSGERGPLHPAGSKAWGAHLDIHPEDQGQTRGPKRHREEEAPCGGMTDRQTWINRWVDGWIDRWI
jgi:hypothetical protein